MKLHHVFTRERVRSLEIHHKPVIGKAVARDISRIHTVGRNLLPYGRKHFFRQAESVFPAQSYNGYPARAVRRGNRRNAICHKLSNRYNRCLYLTVKV